MARDRIDGLVQALEALCRTGVDELEGGVLTEAVDEVDIHRMAEMRAWNEAALLPWRDVRRHRPAFLGPLGIATVEERDLFVAEPAQEPPEAHGEVAPKVVVHHDLLSGREADRIHLRREGVDVGERVAPV